MRIALLFSAVLASACTVGDVSKPNAGIDGGQKDAGPSSDGAPTGNGCQDRLLPAGAANLHIAGGGTNAGLNCMASGCHLNNATGPGAAAYQFAGTVYKPGGTTPSAAAVVQVTGSNGTRATPVYTDDAGRFFIPAGSVP